MTMLLTSLLIAVTTATQIMLGLLGVTMIGTLTGGVWFETIEQILRRSLRAFAPLTIAFLPMLWFLPHSHLEQAGVFLNPIAFDARSVIYWALWNLWAWRLQRQTGRAWAGLGLLVLLFTMTFAAMDWIMMLDREWVSSGFGVIFIVDSLMGALAVIILAIYTRNLKTQPINDFANLLLMSTLLWIYMHYMEYLVIWQGQIPREIRWYDTRFAQPYLIVVWLTLILSFLLPFPVLLFKKLKENPLVLIALAAGTVIARPLEMHGLVTPTQTHSPWPTLALALLLFGTWFYSMFNWMRKND